MRTKIVLLGCGLAFGVATFAWPLVITAAATEPKPEGTQCYATEVCSNNSATCTPAIYSHGAYSNIAVNTNQKVSSGGDQGDSTQCGTVVINEIVFSCGGYEVYTSCQ
jgi:hypothetical protein